ncbi:MAG TPA: ParB/RepB/Spo0J family partition protein [Nitrospirae bacterium]|nr:putative chromosome-partitioning protein ParB [bacterium BMS3Abin10]GBE39876.1 putative chromosome-partitioning protein ParB [bacterium BMS3Bbin08]HDH01029.1 ParB/RepB/Spo0J family partition protein [Nitrospirota bacterium]HDH51265.1 ParB/RepB/Spo0J family partition protein [Nitrospirota bacterium]HDK41325.1 ParB/RepB/Spo0J family partition protein [Nitrospirota bacterium]
MKTALGKGLGALIPEKGKAGGILELDVNLIVPNAYQPRRIFRDDTLMELASSIKEKGVIQPVIVTKDTGNSFQLIAGERRWRAAKLAGLKKLPAILKEAAPSELLELALIENIQREDLNPLESAEAFQRLISDFKLTHDDLSRKIGKDRATVTNYLRILKLPSDIKRWIAEGSLNLGHAKALLQVENASAQLDIARKIIQKGLSVREAEALSKKASSSPKAQSSKSHWKDPQIASLEDKLRQSLGTKVRLFHKGKKGGKIEIEYYSLDELDRLLEIFIPD